MTRAVKDEVYAIIGDSFPAPRHFERYWHSRWRLLDWRTPTQAVADGDGAKVVDAAEAFADGDPI